MDRFQALSTFTRVVEQGSFARAAERMGVSTSAVSRAVSELEAHLGVRLLNRTTRRLSLTESGQAFLERAVQLVADLEEAEAAVSAGALVPRGTLRMTCAITFGERYVAPAIAEFASRHPEMRFDVELSDRTVDLVDEGFDLAIRIGAPGGAALIARRIGATQLLCCAAPAYLAAHGTPKVPEDLARHRCLSYAYLAMRDVWRFRDAEGRERSVRIGGPVHANNGRFLASIAATGAGIALEPDFIVGDDVAAGRLVPLLAAFAPPSSPIYAVYPSRRHLSAKVRTFVDFITERFAREAPWSHGTAKARPGPPHQGRRTRSGER
jgi:DNA-binding transcriptional LysR family regulator